MGIISSLGESLTRNVVQQNMTITCIIHQGGPINTKHAFNQCADLHNIIISPETEETSPAEGESLIYRTVTAHALAALQCHKNASNSTPSPHPLQ